MDILTTAQKFSANPGACSNEEIAALAQDFHLASPQAEKLIAVGNSHPTKWQGLVSEIKRAHFERQNMDSLSKNPFLTEDEIKAMPAPSDMATLPQDEIGKLVFGA